MLSAVSDTNVAGDSADSRDSHFYSTAFRGEPHRFVDLGHCRLAYWRFGQGPDVVFIHGWPLDSATFRQLVPGLCDAFTCHFFDLPGAGQTEFRAGCPIDLRSHASTLKKACAQLGIERYAMVAHDSGAVVARLVAADNSQVLALVIGNSEIPGHRPWLVELYAWTARLPGGAAGLRKLMSLNLVRRSSLGFKGCFTDLEYLDGEFHDLFVQPLLESELSALGQTRLLQGLDWSVIDGLAEVHARIRAPVRLVWGSSDPFFPVARARAMLAQFAGGAELCEIAGAKLFAHEDHPEQFLAYTRSFLEKCSA